MALTLYIMERIAFLYEVTTLFVADIRPLPLNVLCKTFVNR